MRDEKLQEKEQKCQRVESATAKSEREKKKKCVLIRNKKRMNKRACALYDRRSTLNILYARDTYSEKPRSPFTSNWTNSGHDRMTFFRLKKYATHTPSHPCRQSCSHSTTESSTHDSRFRSRSIYTLLRSTSHERWILTIYRRRGVVRIKTQFRSQLHRAHRSLAISNVCTAQI